MISRRNLSRTALLAVLAILLFIMPSANASHQITGWQVAPLPTLDIEVEVPEYTNKGTINIAGRTKAFAIVHGFVNDQRFRVYNTRETGEFTLARMPLQRGVNAVRIEAREDDNIVSKEFTVTFDPTPPRVTLDEELPEAIQEASLSISGSVAEPVTIRHRVLNRKDNIPPAIVENLKTSNVEASAIEITWDPRDEIDFQEYLIERNGKRLATTTLISFRDENLFPDTNYAYSVSAVDDSCNIGTSADVTATTRMNGAGITPSVLADQVNLTCEVPYQEFSTDEQFSFTLTMTEGLNDVQIIFEDASGNQEIIEQTVLMDSSGPIFEQTNLNEISPSYIPDIRLKGKLNEQATVFVYINDEEKPSAFEVTDPDGSFRINIHLRTDVRIRTGVRQTSLEVGEGWANTVRLEAVDLAGNRATYGPVNINFLLCGQGTWWQTYIGEALPSILLPRLMLQGVQQIGIPFNISYIGTHDVRLGRVQVTPVPLAPAVQDEYDHDWIYVNDFTRARGSRDSIGYIQIEFSNVDPLPDKPGAGRNEKEIALSGHRRGECLVPGVGCVKLFLQLEIQFQEIIRLRAQVPPGTTPTQYPGVPIVTPQIERRIQRVCLPVEVAIDQVIPIDVIPEGLLMNALELVDEAIALIDKVLAPLTTIGQYVLYGCMASTVWSYVDYALELYQCKASPLIEKAFGSEGWDPNIAEAGICEQVYAEDKDPQKKAACMACQNKIEERKNFVQNTMRGLCDRIGCPSAPTFSRYIRFKSGEAAPLKLPKETNMQDPLLQKFAIKDPEGNPQLFFGNDCAFEYPTLGAHIVPTYSGQEIKTTLPGIPLVGIGGGPIVTVPGATITSRNLGIRNLYDIAKGKNEGLPRIFRDGPTKDECSKTLHPAHPNCCGVAYQKDWSTACGVGTALGDDLDTFDELKESTCLAAQHENDQAEDLKCNRVWNSIAGFCEKGTGQPTVQPVYLEAVWNRGLPIWKSEKIIAIPDDNKAYLFVVPIGGQERAEFGIPVGQLIPIPGTYQYYAVWAGYVDEQLVAQKKVERPYFEREGPPRFTVGSSKTTTPIVDVSKCFGQKERDPKKGRIDLTSQISCVHGKLCTEGSELRKEKGYEMQPCEAQGNIRRAIQRVNQIVSVPDDQFIVRPNSGFLRSIQCVCLPAVTSYLHMWRSLLGAFHNCFSKILLTGEGSEGFCAAALSAPICDLLFEFISCFTQKFASSGARVDAGPGFGNILGVLTDAGTSVSKEVTERYGDTPLYRSLFSERKLVHAVCTWAFTGTWDLNMQGLFQQQVEDMPVESMAALTTCERTFISYDPTTVPTGLTTWAYRIAGGMIAGADVDYRLKLKCSSGYNCDPRDYPDGKCDCSDLERVIPVAAPGSAGRARKFDVVDFDSQFVISAQSTPNSDVRYDRAILEYTWTDPQTRTVRTEKAECNIGSTEGGNAPLFCGWEILTGKFRCIWGELEGGIKIIGIKPKYPEKQTAFALTQPLQFTLDLTQSVPQERRAQREAKKLLTYDIKDAGGKTVVGPDGVQLRIAPDAVPIQYELETDGTYRRNVPLLPADPTAAQVEVDASPLGRFVLDKDTIDRHFRVAAARFTQQTWPITTRVVDSIVVSTPQGLASPTPMWFSIHFEEFSRERQGQESFRIYRINPVGGKAPPRGPNGWLQYRGALVYSGQQSDTRPVNIARFTLGTAAPVAGQPITTGEQVEIRFRHVTRFNVAEIEILIEYIPPDTKTPAKCNPEIPVRWNAIFTFYDVDRHGSPSDQISTDPETGQLQQRSIPFEVRCADPSQVKTAEPVTPKAFSAAEQGIMDQINAIKTANNAALTKLNNYLKEPATIIDKQGEIDDWLGNVAQEERVGHQTLTILINAVQEPALRNTLQKFALLPALKEAPAKIENAQTAVKGALRGEGQKVINALNTVQSTLTDLNTKADAALQALTAPTPTVPTTPTAPTTQISAEAPTLIEMNTKNVGTSLAITLDNGEIHYYEDYENIETNYWKLRWLKAPGRPWEQRDVDPATSEGILALYTDAISWKFAPPAREILDAKPTGRRLIITTPDGTQKKYAHTFDNMWLSLPGGVVVPPEQLISDYADSVWRFTSAEEVPLV